METKARTTEPDAKSPKPLLGRVAVVTGGSRGLGAAIAKELADSGATVAVNYHHGSEPATHVVEQIEAAGGKHSPSSATSPTTTRSSACSAASRSAAVASTSWSTTRRFCATTASGG